jgi:alkanesulfonate monooxygenase SsuD/methylene tetrahydromethanopterin reductase-like flavin-dependent oxidoreductase (luciferase family)
MPAFTFRAEPADVRISPRIFVGEGDTVEKALKDAENRIQPMGWSIAITNDATGETIRFIGQTDSVTDAIKDGIKGCQAIFRPKNDGKHREPPECNVVDASGQQVRRMFKDWERATAKQTEEVFG